MWHSSGSGTSLTGDYVGVESCIDLRNAEEFEAHAKDVERSYERRRMLRASKAEAEKEQRRRREVKEFPPPITFLARTENQPSRIPWIMKRYYTTDGRLVIREEKVRRREYFRAHRADGRLTLQLIPLYDDDEDVDDDCCSVGDDCDDVEIDDGDQVADVGSDSLLKIQDDEDVEKEEAVDDGIEAKMVAGDDEAKMMSAGPVMASSVSFSALCITMGVNNGGFGGGLTPSPSGRGGLNNKCYGFNSLRSISASSLFDLQVPASRPVIS